MTTPFYCRTTKYFKILFYLFFYNLKQATFVTRSTYELLLFEVVSVNETEMKRLKDLDAGVGH